MANPRRPSRPDPHPDDEPHDDEWDDLLDDDDLDVSDDALEATPQQPPNVKSEPKAAT